MITASFQGGLVATWLKAASSQCECQPELLTSLMCPNAGSHTAYAICCVVSASFWAASGILAAGLLLAGSIALCQGL